MVKARSWRSGERSLAGRPQVGRRAAEQPHQVGDRDIQLPWHGASPVAQLLNVSAGDDTKAAVAALTPVLEITPLLDQLAQDEPMYGRSLAATLRMGHGRARSSRRLSKRPPRAAVHGGGRSSGGAPA
ncbi:MAG TPA: hypothetical protein VOA19_14025, partial [Actinomycetes bacterium]|nr:hypothetical protein [Actinomycetes bacterium]